MTINGTSGNDHLPGTAGDDEFNLTQGGDDTAKGRAGNDLFGMGDTFTAADRIDGGSGVDGLDLHGNYDLTFSATCMTGIEYIMLFPIFDYRLTLDDANVAAGKTLEIFGALTGSSVLLFNGRSETDGKFLIHGGASGDSIATGAGDDTIEGAGGGDSILPGSGRDTVFGGAGVDGISFNEGELDRNDRIDGGADGANVFLSGDYSAGLVFKATTFVNVGTLYLGPGFDYALDASHVLQGFVVHGESLGTHDALVFDAAGNSNTTFQLYGGAAADTLTGGTGYDSFLGNGGADWMKGGGGPDTYYYYLVSDSTGTKYDTIVGFDANENFIWDSFPGDADALHTTAVDHHVSHGALSTANFNTDLEAAIGKQELGRDHAVLFTPDSGGLAGELFLIVDANGHAGYQANRDLVIHFDHAKHMNQFDLDNFSTAG